MVATITENSLLNNRTRFGMALLFLWGATVGVNAGDFTFTTNAIDTNTVTITGYTGSGGDVVIPDTIEGRQVTSIGAWALYCSAGPTNVTIGTNVTSIGDGAFYGCANLISVTIPSNVMSIGGYTFQDCTNLTGIMIPNGVDCIGASAFRSCTNLGNITIGTSVTNIGSRAFRDCASLTNIAIPDGVTGIEGEAFYRCIGLKKVMIPDSVTDIGIAAFGGCDNLTSVTIGSGVINILDGAFRPCYKLTTLTVDSSNAVYSSLDGVLFSKNQTTLIQCPGVRSGAYAIPSTVTNIENYAFYRSDGLTSITIPNTVIRIGNYSFSFSTSLAVIAVDSSNTVYSSLAGVLFNKTQTVLIQYPGGKAGSYMIPTSVTNIGLAAFRSCSSLTSVTIPCNVAGIGAWAFNSCTRLTGVYFKGNAPEFGSFAFDGANATVYHLPGTARWPAVPDLWAGRPTALWRPQVSGDSDFGVHTNQFGFNINWASGMVCVVEACTNLADSSWAPLQTNTLTGDSLFFIDPEGTNYSGRFYRISTP